MQPCRYNTNSAGTSLAACADAIPSSNLQDFNYGFNAGTSDNGNVASWVATGTQNFNRTYTYDALNRLTAMSAPGDSCSGLSWTYDAWGNRTDQTVTGGSCGTFHQAVDPSNHLSGAPYQYDAAGNMTHDASHSYTYDAENRIIQAGGLRFILFFVVNGNVRPNITTLASYCTPMPRGWRVGHALFCSLLLTATCDRTSQR